MTDRFKPYLISVEVTDRQAGEDECSIECDDSNSQLVLPPIGKAVQIFMGFYDGKVAEVFRGVVNEVESSFTKEEGRRLWIEGKGSNQAGAGKATINGLWGLGSNYRQDGEKIPLSQPANDIAKQAGYTIQLDSKMAGIKREIWQASNESFIHWGHRTARELGGIFKVEGEGVARLLDARTPYNPNVSAVWGTNLIQWRIKPVAARPAFGGIRGEHYDLLKSVWKEVETAVPLIGAFGESATKLLGRWPGANETVATDETEGPATDSTKRSGLGWVQLNGEPEAKGGGTVSISGARPGVDGTYMITEAHHTWNRQSGYTTRCDIDFPQGGAGADPRKTGGGAR